MARTFRKARARDGAVESRDVDAHHDLRDAARSRTTVRGDADGLLAAWFGVLGRVDDQLQFLGSIGTQIQFRHREAGRPAFGDARGWA